MDETLRLIAEAAEDDAREVARQAAIRALIPEIEHMLDDADLRHKTDQIVWLSSATHRAPTVLIHRGINGANIMIGVPPRHLIEEKKRTTFKWFRSFTWSKPYGYRSSKECAALLGRLMLSRDDVRRINNGELIFKPDPLVKDQLQGSTPAADLEDLPF